MKLPTPWRALGRAPCRRLRLLARDAPEGWWDEDPMRQRRFAVHRQTRSIVLRWTEATAPEAGAWEGPRWVVLSPLLEPIVAVAARTLGPVEVATAMLARLDEAGHIPAHRDAAPLFARAHRVHLPLLLPPGARLRVDGEDVPLAPAELVEIDNRRQHEALNLGPGPRVHLICDLVPRAA